MGTKIACALAASAGFGSARFVVAASIDIACGCVNAAAADDVALEVDVGAALVVVAVVVLDTSAADDDGGRNSKPASSSGAGPDAVFETQQQQRTNGDG